VRPGLGFVEEWLMKRKKKNPVNTFVTELVTQETKAQKRKRQKSLRAFFVELVIFAGLVVAYFFLVLIFLADWLKKLFDQSKPLYAMVALGLIATQGVVLEVISAALMKVIQAKID
jgi:heme/copper-type cytochrome/quinol oxidase subunit 3